MHTCQLCYVPHVCPTLFSFCLLWGMAKISFLASWISCTTCVTQASEVCIVCVSRKKGVYLALAVIRTIPRTGPVPPGLLVGALPCGEYETRSHPGDFQPSWNTKQNVTRDCTPLRCAALHCYPPLAQALSCLST